jgi:hypothetical protein
MTHPDKEPDVTFAPELREDMAGVSVLAFEALSPGDRLVIEVVGSQPGPLYDIKVKSIVPEGIEAHWHTWWPTHPNAYEEVESGEDDDVIKLLEEELDRSDNMYEHEGLILGVLAIKREGDSFRVEEDLGSIKASRRSEHYRLIFKNAFNVKELCFEVEGAKFCSNPIRNIYITKNS